MNTILSMTNNDMISAIMKFIKTRRAVVLALSAVVVFITTYLLILPALSLERDVAEQQGGIDLFGQSGLAAASGTDSTRGASANGVPQTITNPAGTNIDLFDYWIIDQQANARDGWGDLNQQWGGHSDEEGLNGTGNNKGINASAEDPEHGHALKFSPAWEGTVFNGTKDNWTSLNTNGRDGLNSYTGGVNPFPGIVADTLAGGYPVLTGNDQIGSNGESLAYLFDPKIAHEGKAAYEGVNQLMYVDRDGYYTYDSRDYAADFDSKSGTFVLSKQESGNSEIRGFWPFGTKNYWSGMHVNTQFSMPAGGQVLNPSGIYMPMQFEFSGDDDVWIYVDGILIGDAGGIHNRTEVDINFQTGEVSVTGQQPRYLDEFFRAAGRYNDEEWDGHTFKEASYHTFDFFYLERGGGESNLYIHYNLVSTADFTAHKAYAGQDEGDVLQRDEFQFELIGLDGQYRSTDSGLVLTSPNTMAIMPGLGGASDSGAGTVASPYYKGRIDEPLSNGETTTAQLYVTGTTEDGNINFGFAQISEEDMHDADEGNGPVYKYIIREVIPADAVNADGIRWADATQQQRAAGGFVRNQVAYDSTVYYMTGKVISWTETAADGSTRIRYGLSKTYYTDDTYTKKAEDAAFASFENHFTPAFGKVAFTKTDESGAPLAGAQFALYRDKECSKAARYEDGSEIKVTSGADGRVEFAGVRTGTYYMQETKAPEGYALETTTYKVVIEDIQDSSKQSKITIAGDDSGREITKIVNTKSGRLTVRKKWLNSAGDEVSGDKNQAKVNLYRSTDASDAPGPCNVTVVFHRDGASWDLDTGSGNQVSVSGASAFDLLWHLGNDASHQLYDMKVNGVSVNTQNQTVDLGFTKVAWIPWDGSSSRLQVADIKQDLRIEFTSNCDWFSDKPHTENVVEYKAPEIDTTPVLVDTKTLKGENDWKHVWTIGGTGSNHEGYDLPQVDDNGNKYLYKVVELNEEGKEIAVGDAANADYRLQGYSANNNVGVSGQGVITVYNQSDEEPVSTSLTVVKIIEDTEVPLAGAEFALTQVDEDGHDVEGGIRKSAVSAKEDGKMQFDDLTPGRYRLEETVVPDGYIKKEEAYYIEIAADGSPALDGRYEQISYAGENTFIAANTPGTELPSAGGRGTKWIYLLGSGLLLGCGGTLTVRRRLV